jgi:rubrerythrin
MQLFAAMESAGQVGIICPYARADQCQAVGKETFISLADMEELVTKQSPQKDETPKELPEEALLPSEIARLKRWIQEEQGDTPTEPSPTASIASRANSEAKKKAEEKRKQIESDLMTDEMIASTTKACPSCQFRVTHWHGHSCHHIQPSGGCPKCKVPFCYKCLQSGPVSQRARGAANKCLCGGWSNFCATSDVPNNLALTPYPYDKVSVSQTTVIG